MEISFIAFIENAGLIGLIVLIIEFIKKYMSEDTKEKLKKKKFFVTLTAIVSAPVAVVTCLKDGVFSGENHWTTVFGFCLLFFLIDATASTFFYDYILKKLRKKKDDGNE